MTPLEERMFKMLLLSAGYAEDQYEQLCIPIRKQIHQRVSDRYRWTAVFFPIPVMLALYGVVKNFSSLHNQNAIICLVVMYCVLVCPIQLIIWLLIANKLSNEKDSCELLYEKYQSCRDIHALLDELAPGMGFAQSVPGEEEPDVGYLKLFSNGFAKAAGILTAVFLAIGVFSAGMQNRTLYGINADGVTLVSWHGELDENGVVEIPEKIWNLPVTAVSKRAFNEQMKIRKLIIPDSVSIIDSGAFVKCTALEEIVLPDKLTTLGAEVFKDCTALKSFVAPPLLTEIRAYAFDQCSSLESVVLHDGIEKVNAYAFSNCSSLSRIVMPDAMPDGKISEYAFYGCKKLSSIELPEGIVKISGHAFQGCSALKEIVVPLSVSAIGSSAFRDCASLTKVLVPQKCTVEENSFKNSPLVKFRRYSSLEQSDGQ